MAKQSNTKNSKPHDNLVARDLGDKPVQPKGQTSKADYDRNLQGVYGGKPDARKPQSDK
jgi:hypothetical protein